MTATGTATETQAAPKGAQSLGTVFEDYRAKVRGGDVGALPALAGVIVLVLVFTVLSGTKFTNAFNFANLVLQGSAYAVFAMGLVFVLLLGEIDLSAGYTGGVAAAVVGKLMTDHGVNWHSWRALRAVHSSDSPSGSWSPSSASHPSWSPWPGSSPSKGSCC